MPDGTLLIRVESWPWGASAEQAAQLRNKIEAYVAYLVAGLDVVGRGSHVRGHCLLVFRLPIAVTVREQSGKEQPLMARFVDLQNTESPLSGTPVHSAGELVALLERLRGREPFFAELVGENGSKLLLGIGRDGSCVQFSAADGAPPYLMALGTDRRTGDERELEFLIGNEVTAVARRYSLPRETMVEIAARFAEDGVRTEGVEWEEV